MSTTRYYEETPCGHGFLRPHFLASDWGNTETSCPGGSRRELEGVEIVGWMQDSWGLPVVGYLENREPFKNEDQRFLVIPLEDADG